MGVRKIYVSLLAVALCSNTVLLVQGDAVQTSSRNGQNTVTAAALPPVRVLEPYFDETTPKNVTALIGKSAYLSCRVRNLGNKTVSWIRHRDIHILTSATYTYTTDQRFQANHHPSTNDWTLQIKWTQKRDAGVYECQISTQPVKSYFVSLDIVDGLDASENITFAVPHASILGAPDIYVHQGSLINLTCIAKHSPEPPIFIFWYHNDEVISYDSNRGGVSVITEKGEVSVSCLLMQSATVNDSGKYSCSPSSTDVANIMVHVLNGESPAAMQTGSAGLNSNSLKLVALVLSCFLCTALITAIQVSIDGWK